jgi:uncharacterized protein DUF5719
MKRGEVIGFLVLVAIMVGLGVGDRYLGKRTVEVSSRDDNGPVFSTVWYCPVPSSEDLNSFISTANLASTPVHLRRWGAAEGTTSPVAEADLAPRRRQTIRAADLGLSAPVGVVEAFGAETFTDFDVFGAGAASSRCSDQPQNRWIFPVASTSRQRDTFLLIANPFEEEARIRVRLMSVEEETIPSRLRDFNIPRLSQVPLFLGDFRTEAESFAVEVVATRGRVLVSRLMRVTGGGGRGITVSMGEQESSNNWFFAGGEVPIDGEESIVLVNPGEHEALVRISFQTDSEQITQPALREVAVPAGRQLTINLSQHLPRGTRHGTSIVSVNNTPLVAERFMIGSVAGVRGVDSAFGETKTAKRWVTSVGSAVGGNTLLALVNRGTERAVVSVTLLNDQSESKPPELSAIPVEAGRRATVDLTSFLQGGGATAVIESASRDVVAERMLIAGDPYRDFASQPAVPF